MNGRSVIFPGVGALLKKTYFLSFLLLALGGSSLFAAAPDQVVKQGIDELIQVIQTEKASELRYQKVKSIFGKYFDLPRLAGMTLGGQSWRGLSMDQKRSFTEKYSEFVLAFYLSKLEDYNGQKVQVGSPELKSGGKKALVPTTVEFQGKEALLKYSMVQKGDTWQIYDVEVEGVRLSSTYRNQFQGVLNKSKFEGLLAELDRLIAQSKK